MSQKEWGGFVSQIEQALQEGISVQIRPRGYSMYPFILPERDEVILDPVKPEEVRRGDCILYRRQNSILVLHRVCRITEQGFYFVGDNQNVPEGPLPASCIRGRVAVILKNGRSVSVKNPVYRLTAGLWLWLLPVRGIIRWPVAKLRKIFRA